MPPVITAPDDISVLAEGDWGITVSDDVIVDFLGAASAVDNVDSSVIVSNDAPSTFLVGNTVVTFFATDAAGIVAQSVTATVTVSIMAPLDDMPPVITAPDDISVLAEGDWGITVSDDVIVDFLGAASAVDNVDSSVIVSNDAPSTFLVGNTVVTFFATDAAGNVAQSVTAQVTVVSEFLQLSGTSVTLQDYNPVSATIVKNSFDVDIADGVLAVDLRAVPLNLTNIKNAVMSPAKDSRESLLIFGISSGVPAVSGVRTGTVDLYVTTGADGLRAADESQLYCQLAIEWRSDGSAATITEVEQSVSLSINKAGLKISTTIGEFDILGIAFDEATLVTSLDIKLMSGLSEAVKIAPELLTSLLVPRTLHVRILTTIPITDATWAEVSEINAVIRLAD